jgi:hypothetical protein
MRITNTQIADRYLSRRENWNASDDGGMNAEILDTYITMRRENGNPIRIRVEDDCTIHFADERLAAIRKIIRAEIARTAHIA